MEGSTGHTHWYESCSTDWNEIPLRKIGESTCASMRNLFVEYGDGLTSDIDRLESILDVMIDLGGAIGKPQ